MVKIFGLGILVLSLFGCIKQLEPNAVELTGPKQIARTAPNCAGCHKFPLNDINHQYHLYTTHFELKNPESHASTVPTCMDCHYGSIGHQVYGSFDDTIWAGVDGLPIDPDLNPELITPASPVHHVNIIPGVIPLPWGWDGEILDKDNLQIKIDSAAEIGQVLEWMTGKKHMNKKVDIEFAPSIVRESALRDSAYNPTDFSCSNIGCHGSKEKYRWANKSKGLSFLNGIVE